MTQTTAPSIYSHLPAAEQVEILVRGLHAELSFELPRSSVEQFMDMVGDIVDAAIQKGYDDAIAAHHLPEDTTGGEDSECACDNCPEDRWHWATCPLAEAEDPDAAENYWQPIYDSGVAPDRYAE